MYRCYKLYIIYYMNYIYINLYIYIYPNQPVYCLKNCNSFLFY